MLCRRHHRNLHIENKREYYANVFCRLIAKSYPQCQIILATNVFRASGNQKSMENVNFKKEIITDEEENERLLHILKSKRGFIESLFGELEGDLLPEQRQKTVKILRESVEEIKEIKRKLNLSNVDGGQISNWEKRLKKYE